MIPQSNITENITIKTMPSKTFKISDNKMTGDTIDGIEAVSQAINIKLLTEQNTTPALPYWFGTKLKHLLGQDYSYVVSEAERIIKEALATDDRIKDVTDFEISRYDYDSVTIKFTAITIFGSINVEKEIR